MQDLIVSGGGSNSAEIEFFIKWDFPFIFPPKKGHKEHLLHTRSEILFWHLKTKAKQKLQGWTINLSACLWPHLPSMYINKSNKSKMTVCVLHLWKNTSMSSFVGKVFS